MFDGTKAQSERNYEICADDLRFVERNDSLWMDEQPDIRGHCNKAPTFRLGVQGFHYLSC